jgi:uncharacterized phiE125 gp8 family phage protein
MLKLITPPSIEPVDLDTAKLHVRQDSTADDALITALIVAAREHVERDTNRGLITQVVDFYRDYYPGNNPASLSYRSCYVDPRELDIELPLSPLQAIGSITSYDENNAATVFSAANYYADLVSEPGRIALAPAAAWPTSLRPINGVVIRMTVGYGDTAATVPASLRQAMLLLIGHWYENREQAITSGAQALSVPFGYAELIANYRVYWAG